MLEGSFFNINNIQAREGLIQADLQINAGHMIFDGHFPGQPVVPGVCMIEMIKELFEMAYSRRTRLIKSDHAKFLAMIIPGKVSTIQAEIKYKLSSPVEIEITSSLFHEETTFLKFKAAFKIVS